MVKEDTCRKRLGCHKVIR